ncbi:hypothetical protein [Planktothrix agardhii]|uniref:hypothetical protein n=1 Tax=Planktothrix agardhii TaxID=1160 RepID=UPI001BDFDDB6|nr:hypothetical protein [Planktothrix agardhii]
MFYPIQKLLYNGLVQPQRFAVSFFSMLSDVGYSEIADLFGSMVTAFSANCQVIAIAFLVDKVRSPVLLARK